MGEAVGNRAALFDQIGDYANKKANEIMERETIKAAEEAVRQGGLDPATLKDPFTAADRIYREAALNTHAIGVETTITEKINQFALENEYNPGRFEKLSKEYLKGAMSGLAPELRNPVDKFASSKIAGQTASIAAATQSRVMAESAVAAETYRSNLITEVVNGKLEMDEAIGKMHNSILGDPAYLTEAGKSAAFQKKRQDLVLASSMKQAMDGGDLSMILEGLADEGIQLSPNLHSQLYSASMVKRDYQARLLAQQEAERKESVRAMTAPLFQALIEQPQMSEAEFLGATRLVQSQMAAMGVPADEVLAFAPQAMKVFSGATIESEEVKAVLQYRIFNSDPKAADLVKQELANGNINIPTALEYTQLIEVQSAEPVKAQQWSKFEKSYLLKEHPNAAQFTGISADSYAKGTDQYMDVLADTRAVNRHRMDFMSQVNDPEKPKSINESINSIKSALLDQDTGSEKVKMANISSDNPKRDQVYTLVNDPDPPLKIYNPAGQGSQRIVSVRPSELDKQTNLDVVNFIHEWGPGLTTKENAAIRARLMKGINAKYVQNRINPNEKVTLDALPYSIDLIKGVEALAGTRE